MKCIQVFCGSSAGHDEIFSAATQELGNFLVDKNLHLIYGGGNVGLMGILADTVLAGGGHVTGVIPEFLKEWEVCHTGLNELIVVASMHERKLEMAKRSDATIVLPGGFGTMDEFFEMLTLSQLLRLQQPIGMLNIGGFYDLLLQHLDHMLAMGFLKPKHRNLIYVDTSPEVLFEKMKAYTPSGDIGKWVNRN